MNFQADQLPSITFADLIHPKIDQTTRALQLSDYVNQQLYLIYSGKKVSLQCITAKMITVDSTKRYCNQTTLNSIPFPETIYIGDEQVLKVAIPHHFSSKLDFLNTDMRSISIFQQTNFTEPNFGNQVINFFQTADTIHYSFMFIALVCLILSSCLICFMCYIKCPTCLVRTLCCFANTCCLKKRVVTRDEEINRIREMLPMSNVNYQPVPQNPNVPNPSIQPYPVANPSAPPMSQPQQNRVPIHNCKNNALGCFCKQGGQCLAALSG